MNDETPNYLPKSQQLTMFEREAPYSPPKPMAKEAPTPKSATPKPDTNANREGYKLTKLGWIPEDWQVKKISDLAISITSGTTPLRTTLAFFEQGDIFWVKTTDLNNGDINDTEEKVTPLALKKAGLKVLPKKTVLIAMYGGFNQIGRTGLLQIESTINQALSAVQTNSSILLPEYLIDWLNYGVGYWRRYAASSRKDPNITKSDVKDYLIAVGNTTEQRAIADCLSTWDQAIQTLTQLIAQKELRKKWLMQQLLTGKRRLPGFEGEWKEVKISQILTESRIPSNNPDPARRISVKLNLKGVEKREERGTEAKDSTAYFVRKAGQFILYPAIFRG